MPESVYKVIELVGTSTESWELAARAAVELAAKSLRDLRIAEESHQAETILQIRSLIGDSQRVRPEAMTDDQPLRRFIISGEHPDGRQTHHEIYSSGQDAEALKQTLERHGFKVEITEGKRRT